MTDQQSIHVAAAVLTDRRGRVLIAQRPTATHLAGAWEFPGGKIEPGETRTAGLARELKEELGVTIEHPRPLLRLSHTYPYGEVLLDVWVVRRYQGEPRGLDGQALRWCLRGELSTANLLPADRPIIAALRLPECLRRTSTRWYSVDGFETFLRSRAGHAYDASAKAGPEQAAAAVRLAGVSCGGLREAEAAVAAGAHFLSIRTALPSADLTALCARVSVPVFARGIPLESAWAQGASGINAIEG